MAGIKLPDSGSESSDDNIPAIVEFKRSTSISASQKPQKLPWDKSELHDEISDDIHLDLERRGNKKANRGLKDTYGKTARTSVKQTRCRYPSTSGNSSKLSSPESRMTGDNPFSFHNSVSTAAISFTSSASSPLGLPGKTHPSSTHQKRERKTKRRKKDRSYDRDLKLLEAEYDRGIHTITMQDLGYSKPGFEVETSSRFLSLASRPVEKSEKEEPKSDVERSSFTFRRQSLSRSASKWPNCPRERVKFYEYFSVLIELGSKAKRKREEQLRKNLPDQGPEAWRNKLNDVLWLELQAWMHNQDMHNYDMYLMNEREKIDGILSQIMNFKIEDPEVCAPCSLVCSVYGEIDGSYVRSLQLAYREVGSVLRHLEEVEQLYPCTSKIGLSHAMYERIQFQDKVKALNMWTNFYHQLSFRLQAVSGIICGRRYNDVFPVLPVSLSGLFLEGLEGEARGDVVDGFGALEIESGRSAFSSRASSYHDLEALSNGENGGGDQALQSAIRNFLEKSMRKSGLEKTISKIKGLIFSTLRHIVKNLIQPVPSTAFTRQTSAPEGGSEKSVDIVKLWCDLHKDSNLPCLDRVFAYMLRLPMQILKEGIVLRLEQKPEAESDIATLNQLIHECKDTLILAINIRNDYIELGSCIQHHQVLSSNLKSLDELMKKLLMLYLEYLHLWIVTLQKEPKASRLQKTILEDEWKTMTVLCGGIDDAEIEMPKVFCAVVQGLLSGIGGLLDSGLDDFISSLYRAEEGANGFSPSKDMFRQFFRDCKAVFLEARERCFKLLEFIKILHKDLEIASTYDVLTSWGVFLDLLSNSGHHEVEFCVDRAPEASDRKFRFFVPSTITAGAVRRLLNATMGTRETDGDIDGYLVIVPHCPDSWNGRTVKLDADATGAIRHSHLELDIGHVMIVVLKNLALSAQTKLFEKKLPRDSVKSAIPQTTCHQGISQDLENIKEESLELGKKICSVILRVQDEIGVEQFPETAESERNLIVKTSRELLHQTYNFCIEYHRELAKLNFSDETILAKQLTLLARQWMEFVIQKCERGSGTRPRWSTPGLDYLTVAVKPNYTRYLCDEEFQSLKNQIDTCVTHVIGDTPPPGLKSPTESPTSSFYLSPSQSSLSLHRHSLSFTDSGLLSVPSRVSSKSDTVSCESSEEDDSESYDPHHRMEEATEKLDSRLNQKLVEKKAVGRVVNTESTKTLNHLKARKVPFRWRLCGKLGSGRHADVYKVMNLDQGGLMAVKKFEVTQNTYAEKVTKLATEIEWLAGLKHQNVVRYFGVEIHRDELMLFMEYCDGGTLSEVARQGLDMIMVRVYTKQLLLGISYLHENGICHLDIKGQNVFLTSEGQVKLGDFSEMVKLEDQNGTGTNEITPNTGTPRYMSPEMIRGDTAIGRSTDVWSLGCIVVEMITGKTPKFEKEDNDFAIMFHVGGGGRPKIPDNLSTDAKDFLDHCFEKESEARWKAEKLLNHPFVTVDIGGVPVG